MAVDIAVSCWRLVVQPDATRGGADTGEETPVSVGGTAEAARVEGYRFGPPNRP